MALCGNSVLKQKTVYSTNAYYVGYTHFEITPTILFIR
jgi:hypothetical protein